MGVLLDQVEFSIIRKTRTGLWRVLISSLLVSCLILAFALNYIYKAVLNVNYVTGKELFCPWSRLDQLLNFSALYIPTGACLWDEMEAKFRSGDEKTKEEVAYEMADTCLDSIWQDGCPELIDATLCIFNDELLSSFMRRQRSGHNSCLHIQPDSLGTEAAENTSCFDPVISLLGKYHEVSQRFPQTELPTYIKTKLIKPQTALLVTEGTFPGIWQKFKQAMVEDQRLKFSHNYLSETDRSVFLKQRERLLVASGMPESHTRLISGRIHAIVASGTWDFWKPIDSRRLNESIFKAAGIAPYAPFSMEHDGIYVLWLILGALLGTSTASFLVAVWFSYISKTELLARLNLWFRKTLIIS